MRPAAWMVAGLMALSAPAAMAGDAVQPRVGLVAPFLYQGHELRGCYASFILDKAPGLASGYRLTGALGVFANPGADTRVLLKLNMTKTEAAGGGMDSDLMLFVAAAGLSVDGAPGDNRGETLGRPAPSESGSLVTYSLGPQTRAVVTALGTTGRFRLDYDMASGEKAAPFTIDLTQAASQDPKGKAGRPSPESKKLPGQFIDCLRKLGAPAADLIPPGG